MQESTTSHITEERLSSERNRLLFSALPAATAASFILALLFTLVQWDVAGAVRAVTWIVAYTAVAGVRLATRSRYVREAADVDAAPKHETMFIMGAAWAGAVWGLAPLLMFASDPAHQIFIAFVIAGVSAGAVSTLGASPRASALFLSLALVPLTARFALVGGFLQITMAFMCALFLGFLILSTRRIATTLHENILLRFREEERRDAQRRKSELLQRMGAIARIGTWEFDVATSTTRWSDELYALYGITHREQLTLERALAGFPEPGRAALRAGIERVLADGATFESEQPLITTDGRELWTRTIIEAVYEGDRIARIQGITQDITERRRIDVLKSEFVSTVSHELRTPLTSIRGAIGLIASGATGELPARAKSMLDIAARNSERLIVLINDILDVEKIESGEADFSVSRQEIMPLVLQAAESTSAYAREHGITIDVQGDVHAVADVDGPRLVQVFVNLLSNASKFSPPDAVVSVNVTLEPEAVCIAVKDCGPGISAEFLPRLFDKFSQADSSDQRKKGGTGLGLAISRAITETMGGHITVKTEPGVGSTFTVELPRPESIGDGNGKRRSGVVSRAGTGGVRDEEGTDRRPQRQDVREKVREKVRENVRENVRGNVRENVREPAREPAREDVREARERVRDPERAVRGSATQVLVCAPEPAGAGRLEQLLERAGYHVTTTAHVSSIAEHISADASLAACLLYIGAYENQARWVRDWYRAVEEAGDLPLIVVGQRKDSDRMVLGTAFPIVDWLVKPASTDALHRALRRGLSAGAGNAPRILHVEDDEDLLDTVREAARDYATIEAASSLEESRRKLAAESYDLVLLDPGLPDGSGAQLLSTIIAKTPAPRVVIYSATSLSADDARYAAAAFLTDAADESDILGAVSERTRQAH